MSRPWTDDVKTESGGTRMTVKRCCNGCGRQIGDVTRAELDAAMCGAELPDVREECGCTSWPRVVKSSGAIYSQPRRCKKRRRCNGHLVDRHMIEVGDSIVWSALPPDDNEIGNIGWWHSVYCIRCAPIEFAEVSA